MTDNKLEKTMNVIIAGVGGQGALTLAQLVLGAVHLSGYHCLQSEVHGMSQRGGAVNAHVVFDSGPVTSPVIMEGSADLLIAMEPLEALRYLPLLKKNGVVIASTAPLDSITNYPSMEDIIGELEIVDNCKLVDTASHLRALNNKKAANVILLGVASKYLPVPEQVWKDVFRERFQTKGDKVVGKNIEAFDLGRTL